MFDGLRWDYRTGKWSCHIILTQRGILGEKDVVETILAPSSVKHGGTGLPPHSPALPWLLLPPLHPTPTPSHAESCTLPLSPSLPPSLQTLPPSSFMLLLFVSNGQY